MKWSFWLCTALVLILVSPAILADSELVPATGTRLSGDFSGFGDAYLTIQNSMSDHAVFIITEAGSTEPLVSYFIREGDTYTIQGIPAGTYNFYYELGTAWDSEAKEFTDGNPAMFADYSGNNPEPVLYDAMTAGYEITLYGVVDGNANTQSVGRDDFPKIS